MFAMSPEDIEALNSDFVGALPKMLARTVVKVQQQQLMMFAKLVPQILNRYNTDLKKHTANEDKFYQRWPGLSREQHGELINRYAAVYRQMNPQANLEQMIEQLGPMLYMAARVTPPVGQPAVAPQRVQTNGASPPAGFVPAAPGVASQQQPADPGEWNWLSQRE
jgi:hypothetical protein